MEKTDSKASCCEGGGAGMSCCRVEALLGVDERGQMVLPKELRDRANIKAGDKLAVVSWEKDGLAFLTDSMRMEREDLEKMAWEGLNEVCESLRSRRTTDYLQGLFRELGK